MIITRTPFRMSFFGGGTDLEEYFREYGGAVLSTTFDKYCYVGVNELLLTPAGQIRYDTAILQSEHPMIRHAMEMLDIPDVRLTCETDLPARSGLGTSSSFAVGMLNALHCLKGERADKELLAREAIHLERVLCNEAGGWQDQIAAAYGGFNRIEFYDKGYTVHPLRMTSERMARLNGNLMLFFAGFTRSSSDIHRSNSINLRDRKEYLDEMKSLVYEGESILTDDDRDLDEFGRLLGHTWELKKRTGSAVSSEAIDEWYERGIAAGALGGKLLGAGGGGFLLFYVRPGEQDQVVKAMEKLRYVPFRLESDGTKIMS